MVTSGSPAIAMISPGPGGFGVDAFERFRDVELGDLDRLDATVDPAPRDRLALADRAVAYPAEREPPDIRRRVEVGHERLERMTSLVRRRRDAIEEHLEQRLQCQVGGRRRVAQLRIVGVERGASRARVAIHDRKVDLVLVGVEIEEQLLDLVHDFGDAGVAPVDFVDHEHDRQPRLERLAQHEARLWQRAFTCVDEQEHTVDHRETPLDLATKVGVAGRVDDVDLHVAVVHGRVLGQDRDPLLTLEVGGIHHPIGDGLVRVRAERAGLAQHRVDEGGLAVVDVGHDRHVAQIRAAGIGSLSGTGSAVSRGNGRAGSSYSTALHARYGPLGPE